MTPAANVRQMQGSFKVNPLKIGPVSGMEFMSGLCFGFEATGLNLRQLHSSHAENQPVETIGSSI
jgi:hypothetical protein